MSGPLNAIAATSSVSVPSSSIQMNVESKTNHAALLHLLNEDGSLKNPSAALTTSIRIVISLVVCDAGKRKGDQKSLCFQLCEEFRQRGLNVTVHGRIGPVRRLRRFDESVRLTLNEYGFWEHRAGLSKVIAEVKDRKTVISFAYEKADITEK